MTYLRKILIVFIVLISMLGVIWIISFLPKNPSEINKGVIIRKNENNSFDIYFDKNIRRYSSTEVAINNVDSLIISQKFGTMIYGTRATPSEKKWYYIDASPIKNLHGPWDDSTFRNVEIVTIGFEFLDSVKTSKEIYERTMKH